MTPEEECDIISTIYWVQQRYRNSIQYSKAMPSVDCNNDHNPVLCRMKIKLKCLKKIKIRPQVSTRYTKKRSNHKVTVFNISIK